MVALAEPQIWQRFKPVKRLSWARQGLACGELAEGPYDLAYQTNWLTLNIGGRSYQLSRYRLYMAELGIFLSRDFLPYPNKYRAWSNNPVGQVDRNGLENVEVGGVQGTVQGAIIGLTKLAPGGGTPFPNDGEDRFDVITSKHDSRSRLANLLRESSFPGPNFGLGIGPMAHSKHWITLTYPRASGKDWMENEATRIYEDMKKFVRLGDPFPNIVKVKIAQGQNGGRGRFTLTADLGRDYLGTTVTKNSVDVIFTFDDKKRTIWAVTVGRHPLVGVRKWVVEVIGPCRIYVETSASERARAIPDASGLVPAEANAIGREFLGFQSQNDTWARYLKNIADDAKAKSEATLDPPGVRAQSVPDSKPDSQNPLRKELPGHLSSETEVEIILKRYQ